MPNASVIKVLYIPAFEDLLRSSPTPFAQHVAASVEKLKTEGLDYMYPSDPPQPLTKPVAKENDHNFFFLRDDRSSDDWVLVAIVVAEDENSKEVRLINGLNKAGLTREEAKIATNKLIDEAGALYDAFLIEEYKE